MNNIKIKIWQIFLTVVIAFTAGYFFKWVTKDHSIAEGEMAIWLGAFGTICAIVGAFVLGARQIHVLWKTSLIADEKCTLKKRASFLGIVTAAHDAIVQLNQRYGNTHADKMSIRASYHADTFASLLESLASIPMHELESADATIALAGLKRNMIEAQYLIDRLIASWNRSGDVLFPDPIKGIDLRLCKVHAESYYQTLVKELKPS